MKIKQIYDFLNELSPLELQEKWDNSGLNVGAFNDEFEKIYMSLDLDEELLEEAESNSLVITHHPLIFSPLRSINFDSFSTKLLKIMIKKDIKLISLHTNFDKSHLNKYVAKEVLGLEVNFTGDYICKASVNKKFDEFYEDIKKRLSLEYKKVVKCDEFIKDVSLVTGSGMSFLSEIETQCFLTSDIKYHDAMEAKARGISLIDIGHYESERYFAPLLYNLCGDYLKINKIEAIICDLKNPFSFKN